MQRIAQVDHGSFETAVLRCERPTLVEFYAPWCGPCVAMAPVMEELAWIFQGDVLFYRVNIDQEPELAGRFGALAVPTVLFFRGGRERCRIPGIASTKLLASYIWKLLAEE